MITSISSAQDDIQKWLRKENKSLEKYQSKEDAQFIEFLKKEWKYYPLNKGIVFDDSPKFEEVPIFKPVEIPGAVIPESPELTEKEEEEPPVRPQEKTPDDEKVVSIKEEVDKKEKEIDDVTKQEKEIEELTKQEKDNEIQPPPDLPREELFQIDMDFFEVKNEFHISKNIRIDLNRKTGNELIVYYWEQMATINNDYLFAQLETMRDKMQLNDWGYCLLLNKLGEEIYPISNNEKYLFIWYVLSKTGFNSQVGTINNNIYLFVPTKNKLYGIPFFRTSQQNERLYVINFENLYDSIEGEIYTYEGNYPGSINLLDMNIYNAPNLSNNMIDKKFNFYYMGKKYDLSVKYNQGTIDFYKDYPYSNLDIYFNSSVENKTKSNLLNSLSPLIMDKDELLAANILLRFCQTAFDYKTDKPNFGREKPLFPEETLHYPYSDCEDRSILFAFLIKELLELEVVGLQYPGHIATAVKFKEKVNGDTIYYEGKEFTICDPTYINAQVGIAMPKYKDVKPEWIIKLK